MKLTAKNLHEVHAAHDVLGKGWRVDIEGASWRVESSQSTEVSRAMALRLAVCWNVLEGIPTEALLAGCVADFYKAALALASGVEAADGDEGVFPDVLVERAGRVRAADKAHDFRKVKCPAKCCKEKK